MITLISILVSLVGILFGILQLKRNYLIIYREFNQEKIKIKLEKIKDRLEDGLHIPPSIYKGYMTIPQLKIERIKKDKLGEDWECVKMGYKYKVTHINETKMIEFWYLK